VLITGFGVGQGVLKSGPQAGDRVPGPFHPLNVTGPNAGEKFCLYCENGPAPVAMVFAREVSPGLIKLIKLIDAATVKNDKASMGSFVVFLGGGEELEGKLKSLANKENIKKTVLSIDSPQGPGRYNLSKDADVTVVLYNEFVVVSNHSYRKGELNDGTIGRIVADIPKILPK